MLEDLIAELNAFIDKSYVVLWPWLSCLVGLWFFNIFNWITGSKLNSIGILPRKLSGLMGIFFCPFLHQNFNHLFFNSIPLFVLGLMLLAQGMDIFIFASVSITVFGGLLVWLFGRKALHIGASGLISGYFGFILLGAYFNPTLITILLAILVLYYFGGIFLGIFPQEKRVSWESHLFGFLAGIGSAFLLKAMPVIGMLNFKGPIF